MLLASSTEAETHTVNCKKKKKGFSMWLIWVSLLAGLFLSKGNL